jgi:hypothetical protein
MMKDVFKKYVKESGFSLWENEAWNPGDMVDWSSRYDDELLTFYYLIVKECLAECYTKSSSDVAELAVQQVYERIKKKFGLK